MYYPNKMALRQTYFRSNKLTTFSPTDAKLSRLLSWYKQHKGEVLLSHQQYLHSQFRLFDEVNWLCSTSTRMKYSEKIALLKALTAAKTTWKKYKKLEDKRQHAITKFFKPKSESKLK